MPSDWTMPSPDLPRPIFPRTSTADAEEVSGFAEQGTPSGFQEQRTTPGFGPRTPGLHNRPTGDPRPPTDPAVPRPSTDKATSSRVATDTGASAEEAFKRGEAALQRDQTAEAIVEFRAARDLNPNEIDYAAMLSWAKFYAAADKVAIGAETRKMLERAVFKSTRPEIPLYYLGRLERILGRDVEALSHLKMVLDIKPNHAEAANEIRAINARVPVSNKKY